jgi:hypothetical protein
LPRRIVDGVEEKMAKQLVRGARFQVIAAEYRTQEALEEHGLSGRSSLD